MLVEALCISVITRSNDLNSKTLSPSSQLVSFCFFRMSSITLRFLDWSPLAALERPPLEPGFSAGAPFFGGAPFFAGAEAAYFSSSSLRFSSSASASCLARASSAFLNFSSSLGVKVLGQRARLSTPVSGWASARYSLRSALT